MNKKLVVANWKLNLTSMSEAEEVFSGISKRVSRVKKVGIVICPSTIHMQSLASSYRGKKIRFGVQDVSTYKKGAHTGFMSVEQVKESGARYAIIGHSERREAGETSALVAEKVTRCIDGGISPILCIGEAKRDENGEYLALLSRELSESLGELEAMYAQHLVIAYEPIWAIGEHAKRAMSAYEMHQMSIFIRRELHERWDEKSAQSVTILYGGSVKETNADDLIGGGAVDGFLVGGASLDPEEFSAIIKKVSKHGS